MSARISSLAFMMVVETQLQLTKMLPTPLALLELM